MVNLDLLLKEITLISSPSEHFRFYHLYPFQFHNNITLICGDNGIGKSTFLESLAIKLGCPAEGGSRNLTFSTQDSHIDFSQHLRLIKGHRQIQDVYFYRAESFYNTITAMQEINNGTWCLHQDSDLHHLSHGEAMKSFYHHRLGNNGLYIFDEPESSLSIPNQIDFIEQILKLSKNGSQFIIATHSPVIMAMPEADLVRFSHHRYYRTSFFETNEYYLLKNILNSQGVFLRDLLNYD